MKKYVDLADEKDKEIFELKQETIRLQDDVDRLNGSFYKKGGNKKVDVTES